MLRQKKRRKGLQNNCGAMLCSLKHCSAWNSKLVEEEATVVVA